MARYALASVCAWLPCEASTTSALARLQRAGDLVREVDGPGVSMRLSWWPFQATRTAWALIVIPRSGSRSIESSSCSRISRPVTVSVSSRMRSASVDFPWSMCAMIEKLRIRLGPG